jgi:hypothetical protein
MKPLETQNRYQQLMDQNPTGNWHTSPAESMLDASASSNFIFSSTFGSACKPRMTLLKAN